MTTTVEKQVKDIRSKFPRVKAERVSDLPRVFVGPLALFLVWSPLALLLICAIVAKSLTAYFAHAEPEIVIQLRSISPTALLNLAESELTRLRAKDDSSPAPKLAPETLGYVRSSAELALRNDPLNARAFRILGQLAVQENDKKETRSLMETAAKRSLGQSAALYWMMQTNYEDSNYGEAIRYADALLRTNPKAAQYVIPILGKIAEIPDASAKLKQILASNPPWRKGFFNRIASNVSDARTPLEMLLSLKPTPNPPTSAELDPYLDFLIRRKFYDLAYYTWLQFLSPKQLSKVGLLFNGDFEAAPSGLAFDWVLKQSPGVSIKVVEHPDQEGGHALSLRFGVSRVDLLRVMQLVTLAPGHYLFQGKQNIDLVSQSGLQWRIICTKKKATPLAESPAAQGSSGAWQDFSFSFTVPDGDCPAQSVELIFNARWASERFISGSALYDDLEIVRRVETSKDDSMSKN